MTRMQQGKILKLAAAALLALAAWAYMTGAKANHHMGNEDRKDAYNHATMSEHRTAEEKSRDAGRKPAEVLAFYGVEEGMTVLDLGSGRGYYSVILSDVVGENGKVYAQQPTRIPAERLAPLQERYAPLGNVEVLVTDNNAIDLPDNSVDRVFLFLLYHHWHYNAETGEMTPTGSAVNYAEIRRVLKPGGIFGIIEHEAAEGMSREESAGYHRAGAAHAMEDLKAAGFEFAGASDVLANADDPMNCMWRQCLSARDSSQRFVHAYRSPD